MVLDRCSQEIISELPVPLRNLKFPKWWQFQGIIVLSMRLRAQRSSKCHHLNFVFWIYKFFVILVIPEKVDIFFPRYEVLVFLFLLFEWLKGQNRGLIKILLSSLTLFRCKGRFQFLVIWLSDSIRTFRLLQLKGASFRFKFISNRLGTIRSIFGRIVLIVCERIIFGENVLIL